MADLEADTEPVGGDGRYRSKVSADWEIWGPCGGYVAALALRAAGAESAFAQPTSFFCHYLGVAAFEDVDLDVRVVRRGRATESLAVTMTQGDRPILEAMVLAAAAPDEALAHDLTEAPDVEAPAGIRSVADRRADLGEPPNLYRFWENVDSRPLHWEEEWPPVEAQEPVFLQWERLQPRATFVDPWVDACRSLLWIDVGGWPAASRQHMWSEPPWVAVNVDLYLALHQAAPTSEFLLLDATAPLAAGGLVHYTARTWSEDGQLVASGGGQLLCRPIPKVPNAERMAIRTTEPADAP